MKVIEGDVLHALISKTEKSFIVCVVYDELTISDRKVLFERSALSSP
jgi:hypothetical protein